MYYHEVELIFQLLQKNKNETNIIKLVDRIENFNIFFNLINQNGLNSIIYKELRYYQKILDENFFLHLKNSYFDIVKENMLLTSELKSLNDIFVRNDIEYLSFKGPLLSTIAYGDIISRRYLDLDFLVKIDDLKKIYKLLLDNGYSCEIEISYLEDERFIDISKDLIFFNHKKNITIEVHWKLFEKRFFIKNITFNDLACKNIQFIKINNFTIPTFDK